MTYEVVQASAHRWRVVEAINTEGGSGGYFASFTGPKAKERARQYAGFMNGAWRRLSRREAARALRSAADLGICDLWPSDNGHIIEPGKNAMEFRAAGRKAWCYPLVFFDVTELMMNPTAEVAERILRQAFEERKEGE